VSLSSRSQTYAWLPNQLITTTVASSKEGWINHVVIGDHGVIKGRAIRIVSLLITVSKYLSNRPWTIESDMNIRMEGAFITLDDSLYNQLISRHVQAKTTCPSRNEAS
jgi:hypothetical protein